MAYSKKKESSSSRTSGAKMGKETSSGNHGFSAWMVDKFMGLVTCKGVITDETFSTSRGKDVQKCVVNLQWHNSGVKQTETAFFNPDTKTFSIPEWGLWGSFKASNNMGFFGKSIKN